MWFEPCTLSTSSLPNDKILQQWFPLSMFGWISRMYAVLFCIISQSTLPTCLTSTIKCNSYLFSNVRGAHAFGLRKKFLHICSTLCKAFKLATINFCYKFTIYQPWFHLHTRWRLKTTKYITSCNQQCIIWYHKINSK